MPVTALNKPIAVPRFLRWEGGGQDREGERQDQRGARALDGARGDQEAGIGAQRTRGGRGREQAEPDGEHAPSPEPIAHRRRGHQQHREAEVVRVHGPLELSDRGVQVDADGAQRGRDDDRIQGGHHRGDAGEDDDPGSLPAGDVGVRLHESPSLGFRDWRSVGLPRSIAAASD